MDKEVLHFLTELASSRQWEAMGMRPCFRYLGQLGLLLDTLYPWVCLAIGGINWEENTSGWNAALLVIGIMMSTSSILSLISSFTTPVISEGKDSTLEFHLVVSVIASVVFVIDNLMADLVEYAIITASFRTIILTLIFVYLQKRQEQYQNVEQKIEGFATQFKARFMNKAGTNPHHEDDNADDDNKKSQ